MKKLLTQAFLSILLILSTLSLSQAQEAPQQAILAPAVEQNQHQLKLIDFKKIPDIHNGVAYSIADSKFNYMSTVDVATWDAFNLEVGYAGRAENTGDKAVIALSANLIDLEGVIKFPILKNLEFRPTVWYGFGNLGNWNNVEGDWGVGVTALKIKF